MKTFKYIFLLGALLLASCTDFLDKSPDDMETLDMVFGNKVNTCLLYTSPSPRDCS